jgi:molybdopterin converting factor small subunit
MTVVVEVRLYAVLRKHTPQNTSGIISVEIPVGTCIRDLVEMLDISLEDIKMIMVNGKQAELNSVLRDSDRVGIFPPIGGG